MGTASVGVSTGHAGAGACGPYGWVFLVAPKPIAPDAPVWIWTKSVVEQWHWVEITPDSVSGIPWKLQVTEGYSCPMCRRSIPRTQVDSMKLGYTTWVEYIFNTVLGVAFLLGACCYGH